MVPLNSTPAFDVKSCAGRSWCDVNDFFISYRSYQHLLNIDLEEDFKQISQAILGSLSFNNDIPMLRYDNSNPLFSYGDLRFRITKDEAVFVQGGGAFPDYVEPWSFKSFNLDKGYVLEMPLTIACTKRNSLTICVALLGLCLSVFV
ncbi:MAG: hypothetical protein R2865_04255 [Deinococcales bacterium]